MLGPGRLGRPERLEEGQKPTGTAEQSAVVRTKVQTAKKEARLAGLGVVPESRALT